MITDAIQRVGLPLEIVNIDERTVHETYERNLVLARRRRPRRLARDEMPKNVVEIINKIPGAV